MQNADKDLRELFEEARAIYFTLQHGAITYQQAQLRTKPLLHQINTAVTEIAKKHKVKPQYITFQDFWSNYMKKKEKKLLKMMNEIEHITISLKEIIAAMSPDEKGKVGRKDKEKAI